MDGYLQEFFVLEGATMFRLPLRTKAMVETSEISKLSFDDRDVDRLLSSFEAEAKEALLFLSNVRKITISHVVGSRLVTKSQIIASVTDEGNNRLQEVRTQLKLCKEMQTKDIPWYGSTYTMKISDLHRNSEEWLIHQCLGVEDFIDEDDIPDGKDLGLLPYAGIAACVKITDLSAPSHGNIQQSPQRRPHYAFCSLSMQTDTGLPVHVNGQFALDSSKRNLWIDQEGADSRTEWNEFIMRKVLAPAYAKLLFSVRVHINGIHEGKPWFFTKKRDAHFGLKWYQSLFPDPDVVHPDWKTFVLAVYTSLDSTHSLVLPVLKGQDDVTSLAEPFNSPDNSSEYSIGTLPITCLWLPPHSVDEDEQVYFTDLEEQMEKLLLNIGFPVVFSSSHIYKHFKACGAPVKQVTPDDVVKFLRSPRCNMGPIPCSVKDSKVKDPSSLMMLMKYCLQSKGVISRLHGLPILLTEDGTLRRFDIEHPVFFTLFLDLVPKQKELFLHRQFVSLFLEQFKDPIKKSGIFRCFDTSSLEPYMIHLLPSHWNALDKPVSWYPTTDTKPTREWLTLLWQLIYKIVSERQRRFVKKDESAKILRPLEDWPVIPTNSQSLVSIAFGKTILDLSSQENENRELIRILRKLGCAELDFSVLPELSAPDLVQMLSSYLARPNSKLDVIAVLEHLMKERDISGKLDDTEIQVLLTFLQEDITTVYSHKSTIRSLPFFKTLNGRIVSLSNYVSAYVLELPRCVPLKDIESRVEMEGCVLLEEIEELDPLYKAIDVYRVSKSEVFVKYILPNLDAMTAEGRRSVLMYIRDNLLVSSTNPNERSVIIDTLIGINILPDNQSGELAPASKYYDPDNAVFKSILPEESFPPGEFANEEWLPLLREIGLKQTVTQQDFIEFAESTSSKAESHPSDPKIKERSKALVTYLLEEESLHDVSFLHVIAQIKFVAAEAASERLQNLYQQFEAQSQDDKDLYTAFQGSVSHECEKFLWSSASLLPSWALPKGGENQRLLVDNLGIEVVPPVEKVIKHLENLSKKYAGNVNKDTPKEQRELLHDVIYGILGFFRTETGCPQGNPSDKCTKYCHAVGKILKNVPCIPVEDGRVFVQGEQLAFETNVESPPYLYKVPREYGHFEHVLKRLGAEEKTTPIQFAAVLKRLKEVCEDKRMEPNEKRVARMASQGFFTTVSVLLKEEKESSVTLMLSKIEELYLPNKEGFLKPSHELIVYDNPSFERRASEYSHSFVDIEREGELTADRLAHLFDILPPRLRARTIQSIIREEFHPCSRDKLCVADRQYDKCEFITRYREILLSPKLINGIIRVIKHQRHTSNVPQEVRDQVHVLSSLDISCMGTVETHLVNVETNFPIKSSKESQDCFLEERDKRWELFIKHGTDENPLNIQLCFLINRLIGNHIEKEIYLQAMLACKAPEDILPALDRCGVAQDLLSTELSAKDPSLGTEIPVMYHYLLRQDLDYFFRQGEIVGYEREKVQDNGDTDSMYVYAKIVMKVTENSTSTERTKIDLQARYRIDVGEPKLVEVSVLDLYKFDRSAAEFPTLSDLTDVMLFTGDPNSTEYKASTRNVRMENAMKEVKEVLWEAWKLDEKGRKKVTKRLFLRWHPDKNPGCDIANEIMKFLLAEIERLERLFPTSWKKNTHEEKAAQPAQPAQTFHDLFEKWSQRAHQEWETYNTFKRQKKSPNSTTGSPQRKEAKRWMKQAKDDLTAAKCLAQQQMDNFNNCICFMCQQSAEKAFKAALYALCGIAENQLETHDVLNLAYEITEIDGSPADIAQLASKLKNYYEKTRYPHFHHGDSTPSDTFTKENADEALQVADSIVEKMQSFINEKIGEEL